MIQEQIFLLDITLIKIDNVSYITFDFLTSWDENAWIVNSRSSPTFMLVLEWDLFIWKIWLCYLSYSSDNLKMAFFEKSNASIYYRLLQVLVLLVNFAFYQQCFQLRRSWIFELKRKEHFTGICYCILSIIEVVWK